MRRDQGEKVEHFDINNLIYLNFSHCAVSYTLNGETVHVMLEFIMMSVCDSILRDVLSQISDVILSHHATCTCALEFLFVY